MAIIRGAGAGLAMIISVREGAGFTDNVLQAQKAARRIGEAGQPKVAHFPYFNRIGQFIRYRAPLEEETYRLGAAEILGNLEKLGERRQGARRDDIGDEGFYAVDSRRVQRDRGIGNANGFPEKSGLPRIRLDELNAGSAEDRQHKARKPGTRPEIDNASRRIRDVRVDLGAIENVPAPDIAQRVAADQVDAAVPSREQFDIGDEAIECFT